MSNHYDLVVIGAGAAGCILASRIAQHGKHPGSGNSLKVAMIEAGPYFGEGKNMPGHGHPNRRKNNSFLNFEMGSRYQWPYG
ncbi:MAG: NAD(P)-binding protein, partial [Gammaproteobacteria bacterium]|nr:NAD(P)-binding protein [Gammaproteobacteria bacterium]